MGWMAIINIISLLANAWMRNDVANNDFPIQPDVDIPYKTSSLVKTELKCLPTNTINGHATHYMKHKYFSYHKILSF